MEIHEMAEPKAHDRICEAIETSSHDCMNKIDTDESLGAVIEE